VSGVKIDRDSFLHNQFKTKPQEFFIDILVEEPVSAGVSHDELRPLARRIVDTATLQSSSILLLAKLSGGFTLAATIPADIAQFMPWACVWRDRSPISMANQTFSETGYPTMTG
jgi:hypothetical protein